MKTLKGFITSIDQETLRVLVRDTFVVGFCTWALLYVLELLKPGFASNYISLPLVLLVLVACAILLLSLDPAIVVHEDQPVAAEPSRLLFAVYALVFIVSALAFGLSLWLTLGLAFVTLLALWALSLEWKE